MALYHNKEPSAARRKPDKIIPTCMCLAALGTIKKAVREVLELRLISYTIKILYASVRILYVRW